MAQSDRFEEKIGDRMISDVIADIVGKICYAKSINKKEKKSRRKIYNREVEQFLKRSHDVKEFRRGKVWNVVPPKKFSTKNWVDQLERQTQEYLKNKS